MAQFDPVLAIDLGRVGFANEREPFRVRLDAAPLVDLIEDTRAARRVYDLMLIQRPGDVWPWVEVVIEAIPRRGLQRLAWQIEAVRSAPDGAVPVGPLPFAEFDRCFTAHGEDDDPEQHAWSEVRESTLLRDYAASLLEMARQAVDRLPDGDPLLAHIVATVRDGSHPFHWLPRDRFATGGRRPPPRRRAPPAFLRRLEGVLRDEGIASVSYRGDGDWHVLRALATEQRRRAMATGHRPGHALHVSALTNLRASNEAWGSAIWYFDEGLAIGDLHIEEANDFGRPLSELATCPYDVPGAPGRYIVSEVDVGELPGWSRELGDGHVLYVRETPRSRREGMARIHDRRSPRGWQVLSFGPRTSVYSYDKALVVVGAPVGAAARERLAGRIASWQARGGEVAVWVEGDSRAFDRAGCREVVALAAADVEADGATPDPEGSDQPRIAEGPRGDTAEQRRAKAHPIRMTGGREAADRDRRAEVRHMPMAGSRKALVAGLFGGERWIDVVIALDPPAWVAEAIARHERAHGEARCWPLFLVATAGTPQLEADHWIEGDLDAAIAAAVRACQH